MYYEIKKGQHYSNHFPKIHFGKTRLKAELVFGAGCWFPLNVPDDYAINKLTGISHGYHHRNSVRVGWRPNPEINRIDLFFYAYSGGKRTEQYFATVDMSGRYQLIMDLKNDLAEFSLRQHGATVAMGSIYYKMPWFKWGYCLFPYVGGNLPARTDTFIGLWFL